jgi:hypothetical protein
MHLLTFTNKNGMLRLMRFFTIVYVAGPKNSFGHSEGEIGLREFDAESAVQAFTKFTRSEVHRTDKPIAAVPLEAYQVTVV